MREIKFRAWTGEKMRPCMVSMNGKAMMDFGPTNSPLMQFTGLHDKNGKPIYEGDIIEGEDPQFESGVYKYEAVFQQGCFWAVEKTPAPEYIDGFKNTMHPLFRFEELEVIGNIYENPELLV